MKRGTEQPSFKANSYQPDVSGKVVEGVLA